MIRKTTLYETNDHNSHKTNTMDNVFFKYDWLMEKVMIIIL